MIVRNVSSREGSTIHRSTRSTASPHRRLVSWSRTRAPARPRSRNARRIPDTACRRRVSINPRGVRSTAVAHWSGTSMFGTPSNHSSMFRCASSHDAMRWSGVARAKINPEYGSTATNTCAFMRRPAAGSAGCGQSPVQSPDTLSPGTCSKRAVTSNCAARAANTRAERLIAMGLQPLPPGGIAILVPQQFQRQPAIRALALHARVEIGMQIPLGALPRPGREPTLRDLAIAQGRQQGGIHRTLPDDPGGTRHITLATMRGTRRPRLRPPPSTASSSPVSNARPSSASFQ